MLVIPSLDVGNSKFLKKYYLCIFFGGRVPPVPPLYVAFCLPYNALFFLFSCFYSYYETLIQKFAQSMLLTQLQIWQRFLCFLSSDWRVSVSPSVWLAGDSNDWPTIPGAGTQWGSDRATGGSTQSRSGQTTTRDLTQHLKFMLCYVPGVGWPSMGFFCVSNQPPNFRSVSLLQSGDLIFLY